MIKKRLKVFVISPSDVQKERNSVVEVCKELNKRVKGVHLEPILWEYSALPLSKNPQEAINKKLENADIYIIILWYRLGSQLPILDTPITYTKNPTGTQYEIEWLIHNKKEHIYLFLKNATINIELENLEEAHKQREKLTNFLEKIEVKSEIAKKSFQEFKNIAEFKTKIEATLTDVLEKMDIKVLPKMQDKILSNKIDSSYYMGLYVFLAFVSAMFFVWLTKHSNSLTKSSINIILSIILGVLITLIMAIKAEPITTNKYKATFKQIAKALAKRFLFVIFIASMLSFMIWYLLIPTIQDMLLQIFK